MVRVYKITARRGDLKLRTTLWRKYWFFYLPITIWYYHISNLTDLYAQIDEWIDNYQVKQENVSIKIKL